MLLVLAQGAVRPSRASRQISRSTFEKVLDHVPLSKKIDIDDLQGPTFIDAILMDERIRAGAC